MAENGRTCSVPFGQAALTGSIPPENWLADVEPGEGLSASVPAEELLEYALAHPIGSPRLADMVGDGDRVVVVTSDVTRPCPSHRILPSLLSELRAGGVDPGKVTVVLALGDLGLAAVTTVVAAIVAQAGARGALFTVLAFPLLLPLLISSIEGSRLAMTGEGIAAVWPSLQVLSAYTVAMVAVSLMLFPMIWTES